MPPETAPLLPFRQIIAGCLPGRIGAHGLDATTLDRGREAAARQVDRLLLEQDRGTLPLLGICAAQDDLASMTAAWETLSAGARTVVFFGTGGSSLGGQALAQLAGWNIPGGAPPEQKKRPRTRFYDNLDADTLGRSLADLDLAATRFVFTSKSGNTPETLVQAIVTVSMLKSAGLTADLPRLVLGITEPAEAGRRNGLRDLLAAHRIPMLDHHTGIGGRFSGLTNVGLLPALARGLDPVAVRKGAAAVLADMRAATDRRDVPAAVGAAVVLGLADSKGTRIQVMMPYANRLGRFAHWFVQLWAESLGKNGSGTTPIAALGPLDQHSQLQLFMDGPREHLITVLRLPTRGQGPVVDADLARAAGFAEMAGRATGDLVDAQANATPDALAAAGRPVRIFELSRLDETTMGALMMHFFLETIIAGRMLGIDPFDQPAVELGKTIARERLLKLP